MRNLFAPALRLPALLLTVSGIMILVSLIVLAAALLMLKTQQG